MFIWISSIDFFVFHDKKKLKKRLMSNQHWEKFIKIYKDSRENQNY